MPLGAPPFVDVPEAVQPRPAPLHRAQQVLAAHVLVLAVVVGYGVEDAARRAVREEDVDGRVRGDGGGSGRGVRVEAVLGAGVGEGPIAEFGLVGGGVDL